MPLVARDGRLLRTSTGLASSLDCCCGSPPLPDCACPPHPCFAPGMTQPSSIRIELELDDSFGTKQILSNIPPQGACASKLITRTTERLITGLSALNGSYDLQYYRKDQSGDFIAADPLAHHCGYWFFPYLEATTYRLDRYTEVYQDACQADVNNTTYDGPDTFWFRLSSLSPGTQPPYVGWFPSIIGGPPAWTSLPSGSRSGTASPYECHPSLPPFSGSSLLTIPTISAANFWGAGWFSFSAFGGTSTPLGLAVNIDIDDAGVIIDGVPGDMSRYHRTTETVGSCDVGYEESSRTIDAYNHAASTGTTNYSFEWNEFNGTARVILGS